MKNILALLICTALVACSTVQESVKDLKTGKVEVFENCNFDDVGIICTYTENGLTQYRVFESGNYDVKRTAIEK